MGYVIFKFVFGIGGILRWLFFQILNIPMNDKFSNNLSYYHDDESEIEDNNGFTTKSKNGFAFLFFVFLAIILIEKTK
jgi:uncharacterized protein YdaL